MADLNDFVKKQLEAKKRSNSVDWSKRKDKFDSEISKIFNMIEKALLAAGLPATEIEKGAITLHEDYIGPQTVPTLSIKLAQGGAIQFEPVATLIVGGYGRIDAKGPGIQRISIIAEDAMEFRDDNDETPAADREWQWFAYPNRGMKSSIKFDEDGLSTVMSLLST